MSEGFSQTPMGFHMNFPNGWTASVQFGTHNYCSNYMKEENKLRKLNSTTAEIAAFPTDKNFDQDWWTEFDDGEVVKGWCNVTEVLEFLNNVSKYGNFIDCHPIYSEEN